MHFFRLTLVLIAGAVLSACAAGSSSGGAVAPGAIAPASTMVLSRQTVVQGVPSGSAPAIKVNEYRLPGYTGGVTIAFTSDGSIWTGTDSNSAGQQGLVRVHGKLTTFYPFSTDPNNQTGNTSLLSTPNGRVWSIGVDNYYASPSTTQAILGPVVPQMSGYQLYQWGPGATGPDGNVWFPVYGGIFEGQGCQSLGGEPCPPEELVKVNQGADSGSPTMYKPPQDPNGEGTEPTVVAVGPDNDIWIGGTNMPNIAGGTGFDRFSTSGVYLGSVPVKLSYMLVGAVAGPDHNMWVLGGDDVLRVTPAGVTTDYRVPTSNSGVFSIAVGSDGALWFTEAAAGKIGRITTSGKITEYPIPGAGPNALGVFQITKPSSNFASNELWAGAGGYGRPATLVQIVI